MTLGAVARLAPSAWMHTPRPTARLRLTLLYGALFLVSGAVLLTATYLLVEQATSGLGIGKGAEILFNNAPGTKSHSPLLPGAAGHPLGGRGPLSQVQVQAAQRAFDMHELLIRSAIALGLMALISIALGWLVAGRVLRPVRIINATARQIGASNLHERLSLDGPDDEFRELAATLDDLLERLEKSFDSQRRFVANASHELRTPLTLDRALLERALRKRQPDEAFWRATCEELLASSQQQDHLVEALLTLARSESGVSGMETFELSLVVDNVLLGPELDDERCAPEIETKIGPAPVSGDPRLIERLVRNLIDNALRYNQPRGRVDITTRTRSGHAVLTISNTGPTIPAADLDRLFQPFERLTPNRSSQGDGTGLGLSIVKAIADAHRANVTATPQPTGGLRVEVTFPPPESGDLAHHKPSSHEPAPDLERHRHPDARTPRPPDREVVA